MTDLSVIIVSFKGWDRLLKCLESLGKFTGDHFSSEVIIVDNNSAEERIYEIEKSFPAFRFVHNKVNGGFSNGCNLGARYATGEFLLFLNPDTVATEEETEKLLLAAKRNHDYYIVSCRQVNEKGHETRVTGEFPGILNMTGIQRSLGRLIKKGRSDKNIKEIQFPDWVSGSVIMIRKEIFRKIRGFDEDFWMYYEDVDICRRISNAGGKVAYFSNITIEHNHGGSSRIDKKTASLTKTEVNISRHVYISKNKSGIGKYVIQLFLLTNNLVSGLLQALPGALLFFVPELFVRTIIFVKLSGYYIGALSGLTWLSPRSVNYNKTRRKETT
jgi:GT2 family glycosyltransferase